MSVASVRFLGEISSALEEDSLPKLTDAFSSYYEHCMKSATGIFKGVSGLGGDLSGEVFRLVRLHLRDDDEKTIEWCHGLMEQRDAISRSVGLMLLAEHPAFLRKRGANVPSLLEKVADDERWGVRESAASAFGELLIAEFDNVYRLFWQWREHPSPNIRRAIVLACKYAAKTRTREWAIPLLDLLQEFLGDSSVYVRKNLGPFAIGDQLLRSYPRETLVYAGKWSQSTDKYVRWNTAMIFYAAEGARHVDQAAPILAELATDPRRFVWRAVASALLRLSMRKPAQIDSVLQQWSGDKRRRHVAETVYKRLRKK